MRRIAEGISNARLVTLDAGHFLADLYTQDGSMPSIVPLIEDFMGNLPEKGMDGPRSGLPSLEVRLSPRELEVLSLVADGRTNREIAERLVISERTVVNHLSHIFTKTGVENRASAAAYAFRHGIV